MQKKVFQLYKNNSNGINYSMISVTDYQIINDGKEKRRFTIHNTEKPNTVKIAEELYVEVDPTLLSNHYFEDLRYDFKAAKILHPTTPFEDFSVYLAVPYSVPSDSRIKAGRKWISLFHYNLEKECITEIDKIDDSVIYSYVFEAEPDTILYFEIYPVELAD